jgi:hypothetical protein
MINLAVLSRSSGCIRARTALLFLGVAILLGGLTPVSNAQATYTADRINGFSVFGGISRLNTDYGATDNGYMFGGDLTHSIGLRLITPSLELRYTGSTGPAITQNSYLGGVKVETKFRRLRPYADLMIGYGQIHYVQYSQGDDSIAYNVGVGADYNVFGPWAVKIDAQEQFWKLGQATNALTPQMVSVGVLYRLPGGFGRSRK